MKERIVRLLIRGSFKRLQRKRIADMEAEGYTLYKTEELNNGKILFSFVLMEEK